MWEKLNTTVHTLQHYTAKDRKHKMFPSSQAFYLEASNAQRLQNFLKVGQRNLAMQIVRTTTERYSKGYVVGITNH